MCVCFFKYINLIVGVGEKNLLLLPKMSKKKNNNKEFFLNNNNNNNENIIIYMKKLQIEEKTMKQENFTM